MSYKIADINHLNVTNSDSDDSIKSELSDNGIVICKVSDAALEIEQARKRVKMDVQNDKRVLNTVT